jgi:cobalamin biosynthetic protein CobC
MTETRDHGGGLDAAIARHGGTRADWLDISTGINPVPYPVGDFPADAWTALPDSAAMDRLLTAARRFWQVPAEAQIVAAPGASALIARMPDLCPGGAYIPGPTYNEHAAAFRARQRAVSDTDPTQPVHVYVHPNNPDGRLWPATALAPRPLTILDESFCDVTPAASHVARTTDPSVLVLKSFGKFWGLAGLRLGFAIGSGAPLRHLPDLLGPWPVAGPALAIGARALEDTAWADDTRARLTRDAARLDALMSAAGATLQGGTTLFRLYAVDDASAWQDRLARHRVWSRIFPYSATWLRLGLPHPDRWYQLARALT